MVKGKRTIYTYKIFTKTCIYFIQESILATEGRRQWDNELSLQHHYSLTTQ